MTDWKAHACATLVGSMPHKDRSHVIDLILESISDIPVWPQLSYYQSEQMLVQYLEGLPGIQIIDGSPRIFTNVPEFDQELYGFYEDYLKVTEDLKTLSDSRFAMSAQTGSTLFAFIERLRRHSAPYHAVKGQVVGPFTLLGSIKDENERAALYDERLQEVVVKHIAMKAMWQICCFEEFGKPIIIFVDEPALAGFGSSAFISVSEEMVSELLEEVYAGIHQLSALAGIHVCANTDWNLAFRSSVDIINFDAYNYFDKFSLYKDQFEAFIERGGVVAWGMVPTTETSEAVAETAISLKTQWQTKVRSLASDNVPVSRIVEHSLFTPSCGCGTLSEARAEQIVRLTDELASLVKQEWFGK